MKLAFLLGAGLFAVSVAKPTCCWSKWGDTDSCGSYVGPGAKCNTSPNKTCNSNGDCPDTPAPAPTPTPPTPPTPPAPPSPPSPPSPSPSGMPDKVVGLYL